MSLKAGVTSTVRVGKFHQIFAIFRFAQLFAQMIELVKINPSLAPCYLLDAAHAESLAVLYGGNEVACFEQAVTIAGVEPGKATTEKFHFQRAFLQIKAGKVGNLIFAAGRRFQGCGLFCHSGVVEV